MTLFRSVARPMLASVFLIGGAASLRNPGPLAVKTQPVADVLTRATGQSAIPAVSLVRGSAVLQLVAGALFATGRLPRITAIALAATMPGTTVVGHPFWNETDPQVRTNQRIHFFKNLAITGGLLMSTLDPNPDRPWSLRRKKSTSDSGSAGNDA